MKLPIPFSLVILSLLAVATAPAELATLEMVASFPDQQVTGVAVSREGRFL